MCLGISNVISGLFSGIIYDKYGNNFTAILAMSYMLLAGVLTGIGLKFNSLPCLYCSSIFFGLADSAMQTVCSSYITEFYLDHIEVANAVYRIMFSLGFIFTSGIKFIIDYFGFNSLYYYLCYVIIVAIILIYTVS